MYCHEDIKNGVIAEMALVKKQANPAGKIKEEHVPEICHDPKLIENDAQQQE